MTESKTVEASAAKKRPVPVEVQNTTPVHVEVDDEIPIDVRIAEPAKPTPIKTQSGEMSLPPTTTREQDIVTAGQRHINLIWESVQGIISVGITASVIYCQINAIQSETLNNAFFFVVATYLQRSNHVRIGGTGQKANEEPYRGR